jgi:class 3 adenylate cyclase/tetratricopeptide (TPR) repeat protein
VVFADLEGFTALAEERDPESVKELLDACFGRLVPVIEGHGGHVDKIIGDEIMAFFGAPIAHEDDPERALRAALDLGPALAEIDPALRLRVGVNTGEVLAGAVGPSFGYTVTGDVVNTAHRLVTHARPGEVLVGERTQQATVDRVAYELRGELELRGKVDPVRAWAAGPMASRPAYRGLDAAVMPLTGRQRELAELRQQVAGSISERRVEVITLVGEAGVGKTRLAMELAVVMAAKPATAQVLWVSCPPYGRGGELAPLADLVRSGLGVGSSAERTAQDRLLAGAVTTVAAATGTDAGLLGHRLGVLLGIGTAGSRPVEADARTGPARAGLTDQQLGAVRTVLGHLARTRPVLVVVDDLHWAGTAVLRFLAQLPDRLSAHPIVVVALARDDLLERRSSLVDAGPGRSTRRLEPLAEQATADLVLAMLARNAAGVAGLGVDGDGPVRMGPAALQRLVAASAGNPLLVEQLVRFLVESDALVMANGRWQWTTDEDGNESGLPDGVRSLIGARLDGLPAAERQALSHASVFGRRFWRQALVDLGSVDDVEGVLGSLDARGLTQPIPDEGYGDHAFRHVLTRDVAYAALPIGARAIRHGRLAAWLERRFDGMNDPEPIAQLAHHYERAVVLSRSIDQTDPGLAGAAFAALIRAARDEHRRESLRGADHWYRRARDLGSPDVEVLLDAIAEHGQVLLELRRLDAAEETFEELARRAASHRPTLQARARAHLAAVARLQGDLDGSREGFEAAAGYFSALDDLQGQVDVLRLQGWSEITAGRPRAALPRLQRAVSLEDRLDEPARRGETLRFLGWCEFLSGELASARTHLWEAMAHSHDANDQGAIGWCFGLLAQSLLQGGQAGLSLDVSRNLREVAGRASDPWGEWTCATLEASSLLSLGHLDDAAELAAEAERHFEELEEPWGLALSRVVRARAARVAGDVETARAILQRAIASSRDLTYVGEDARLLVELARVELESGDLREAERQGRSCLALVRAGFGDHESGVRCLVVLAEVERARGAAAAAELLLEEAVAPRPPADRSDGWRQAALALAELRLAVGDHSRARELLDACDDPPTEEHSLRLAMAALTDRLAGHR